MILYPQAGPWPAVGRKPIYIYLYIYIYISSYLRSPEDLTHGIQLTAKDSSLHDISWRTRVNNMLCLFPWVISFFLPLVD